MSDHETSVEIEYCVPCGHLTRAIDTERALLEHFGRDLDGVYLKTGHGGVFTIRVDGDEIYDKTRAFDMDQIIDAVEALLTPAEA
jgi:selenoprotein W-related protein